MNTIKEILHKKREATEKHIKQLQQEGKQGIRYTAMIPDIPFLILGLLSDIGWAIHLIAGIMYFNKWHYIWCNEVSTPMRCIAPMDVVSKEELRSENTH